MSKEFMSTRFLCATLRWNIKNQISICDGLESLIRFSKRRNSANRDAFWIERRNVEKLMHATPIAEELLERIQFDMEEILSLKNYESIGIEFSSEIYKSTQLLRGLKRKDQEMNFEKMKLDKKLTKLGSRNSIHQ